MILMLPSLALIVTIQANFYYYSSTDLHVARVRTGWFLKGEGGGQM